MFLQDCVLQWLVNAMKARQIALDQRDHCGDTPLHLAARTGHLDTCRILLSAGSNVSAKVQNQKFCRLGFLIELKLSRTIWG